MFVLLLSATDILYFLDKKVQNFYYTIYNSQKGKSISKDIIVVEIDDKTLEEGWSLWRFPFDRKDYIPIIENLNSKWASIIAFDIIFTEETESDELLWSAIKDAWNVIVWSYISSDNKFKESIFNDSILTTGFLKPKLDPLNHVVYSLFPYYDIDWIRHNHFSIAILKAYFSYIYGKDYIWETSTDDSTNFNIFHNKKIPYSNKWKKDILINYVDEIEYKKLNHIVSFIDIYDKEKFEELSNYVDFKDKIVLIWASASWIKDIFYTPNGIEPWVYVHVNMINTVLTKSFIKYFDKKLEFLLLFLLIILSAFFNLSRSWYVLIASNIAIASIFLVILPGVIVFSTYYTWILIIPNYFIEFLVALILSLAISNIVKYLIENKHKARLNKALSEYVSKDIAKEILSWEWKVDLDWENKKTAIFFSDIEWFTSISEKFEPEELVAFLREYLWEMSDIIMDEKWFINKYEWDAIMALWWVFWENMNDSYKMCLAALKQQEKLRELNKGWKEKWFTEIKARIWMHFWNAIIWNIWSEWRKIEFTALWDSVNLASRLEGVNKFYWTYMCVSENVYNIEKWNFEFRYLDRIRVKWKDKPVNIYELLWYKWKITKLQSEIRDKFDIAVDLYINREFEKAKEAFTELIEMWDNASKLYLDMCELYIKSPPSSTWDWVSTMTSK